MISFKEILKDLVLRFEGPVDATGVAPPSGKTSTDQGSSTGTRGSATSRSPVFGHTPGMETDGRRPLCYLALVW